MDIAKPTIKDGKLVCPCSHQFEIDLIAGSGMRVHTRNKTEINIIFDQLWIQCPDCKKINRLTSSLVDTVVHLSWEQNERDAQSIRNIARLRTNKLDEADRKFDIPRLTKLELQQFILTLSELQKTAYKNISDPGAHYDPPSQVLDTIAKALSCDTKEAHFQFLMLRRKVKVFRALLSMDHKKFSIEEIKTIYDDPAKFLELINAEEKSIDPKDEHKTKLFSAQKSVWLIDLFQTDIHSPA